MLPLIDYLVFDTKSQMQNRRNTVRYSREQQTQLMEDALNVYVSYAKRLSWPETFKLIRKFLFKMERAQRLTMGVAAEKTDTEMEKTVTKSLCKVLEGLSLNDNISLPDAVDYIDMKTKESAEKNPERQRTEFSTLLDELVGQARKEDGDENEEEVEEEEEIVVDEVATDNIMVDKEMAEADEQQSKDAAKMKRNIQMKL